jgi:hypothetical protein
VFCGLVTPIAWVCVCCVLWSGYTYCLGLCLLCLVVWLHLLPGFVSLALLKVFYDITGKYNCFHLEGGSGRYRSKWEKVMCRFV